MSTVVIKFFQAYSKKGQELVDELKNTLCESLSSMLKLDFTFTVCDSIGLSLKQNSPFQVLSAAFNNEIVIIDGSIENAEGHELGDNYECITPAVSSLDNVLVVSRTQLPLNFVACRTNVAALGEKDILNPDNNKGGYSKEYSNDVIREWIISELCKMHENNRLIRSDELKIGMTMPFSDIMKKEMEVIDENLKARQKEKHPKKQIFISYRTSYCDQKYKGKYDIAEVVNEIKKYHSQKGDIDDWDEPFFFPNGVLSNEFMPEIRRWAFICYPDRKIRESDEFWIFNTQYQPGNEEGEESEVGYWDSWWCLGEFMTIVRMKHDKQLICGEDGKIYKKLYEPVKDLLAEKEKKGVLIEEERKEFKVMLFSPDKEDPFEELSFDQIPEMTEEQNSILSKYFVNSDFRQSGLESMAVMRYLRYWPKFIRRIFHKIEVKFVFPRFGIDGELEDIGFDDFEKSVFSHAYDESFTQNRLLECSICSQKGKSMEEVLHDDNFVWDFLNINNYHYLEGRQEVKERTEILQLTEKELTNCRKDNGDFIVRCNKGHKIVIRKSEDKFYLYWTPRRGKRTGPNNCIIETVNLYEVVK